MTKSMSTKTLVFSLLSLFLAVCVAWPSFVEAAQPDELVLAVKGEPDDGFDPTMGWGRYGSPLFQSTLLKRDQDMNIVNDLALSHSLSQDRLTWTITIRKDAKFSDGTPLTAHDVAYTFAKAAETGGMADLSVLEKAEAVDDYTVTLKLKKPWITFIQRLITLGVVPKNGHGPDYAKHPVGSGPYKLVSWTQGEQMVVEANPYYYGEATKFKRIVFLFTAEDASFAAAKAGKLHMVVVPQALAVQTLPHMKLLSVKSVDNRGLMFPYVPDKGEKTAEGAPIGNNVTADPAIRKAINYAIDRQALTAGVLEGFGAPAYSVVDGLPWGNPETKLKDADLDKAGRILAEGGWKDADGDGILEKDGLKAEFNIIYPSSDSTRQGLALASSDMIKKIGIKTEVLGKSWDEIKSLKHSNVITFGWGAHDPTELYYLYHSSLAGKDYYNAGYYSNPAVDEYMDKAMDAPSFEESLPLWKAAQWDGKTGLSTLGDAPWAWLINLDHTYFVHECLDVGKRQIEPHGHGWPITTNIPEWRWICE